MSKFGAQSGWIKTFEQIGFGQWFRYLTGAIQMVGAIAVLIPRIFPWGILMLACTMLGAMTAWIFLLGAPLNAVFPGGLLAGLLLVGGEDLINLVPRYRGRTITHGEREEAKMMEPEGRDWNGLDPKRERPSGDLQ